MVAEAKRRKRGRPTWQETVDRANAREAELAAEAPRGRPKKEDMAGIAPPVTSNLSCTICQEPVQLPDLWEHAEAHNRTHAETLRQAALSKNHLVTHGTRHGASGN